MTKERCASQILAAEKWSNSLKPIADHHQRLKAHVPLQTHQDEQTPKESKSQKKNYVQLEEKQFFSASNNKGKNNTAYISPYICNR